MSGRRFQLFAACIALMVSIGGTTVFSVQSTESPAVVLAVVPAYGPSARSAHASGEVPVDVVINPEGVVTSAKALSGHAVLRVHSEKAALRWKFVEAVGGAGERHARLAFVYRLVPSVTPYYEITPAVFSPPYKIEVTNMLPEQTPLPSTRRRDE
jgi:hypothetical protein